MRTEVKRNSRSSLWKLTYFRKRNKINYVSKALSTKIKGAHSCIINEMAPGLDTMVKSHENAFVVLSFLLLLWSIVHQLPRSQSGLQQVLYYARKSFNCKNHCSSISAWFWLSYNGKRYEILVIFVVQVGLFTLLQPSTRHMIALVSLYSHISILIKFSLEGELL